MMLELLISANQVAHALARAYGSFSGFHVWGLTPLSCIAAELSSNVN